MTASVSVVIPCYRCAATIGHAVESVVAQTLLPQEILLVDDFCNDDGNTVAVLSQLQQTYQHKVSIKIIQLKQNGGPGEARNKGWEIASQPYIAFLDADDSWHPKKLEIQYQWMMEHPEVAMSGHRSIRLDASVSMPDLPNDRSFSAVSAASLLISNCFPTRSVMLKRDVAFRFIPKKRYAEDYLLWLTLVFEAQSAWLLDVPLAYSYKADFGESGLTGDLWEAQKGVMDTYKQVFIAGHMSFLVFVGLILLSVLKFVRRVVIVKFNFIKRYLLNILCKK